MIRKGRLGASAEDGVTPQIFETTAAIGRSVDRYRRDRVRVVLQRRDSAGLGRN